MTATSPEIATVVRSKYTREIPRPAGECTDLRDDGLNYRLNHSEAYDLR
jgi:hypothetical protein